jgi:hypothetical protein
MITRGHFVGQIIDELGDIASQVETRSSLGLTDLNLHLENFFREVLNIAFVWNLVNLNANRSNNPGLDLGDEAIKTAFKITSIKTSAKINETLEKIADEDLKRYETIRVLIIGRKQGSYTLDPSQYERCRFNEFGIWDIFELCKQLMDIPLDRLQKLADYVRLEVARVKIELEIPTSDGKFPTSIGDYVEKIPRPRIGTCESYCKFQQSVANDFQQSPEDVKRDLIAFSNRLAKLPRITREFFALLLERLDGVDPLFIRNDKLRRICSWSDIDGELRLLEAEGFVSVQEAEHSHEGVEIRMRIKGQFRHGTGVSEHFCLEFMDYVLEKNLSFQRIVGNLDFGDF